MKCCPKCGSTNINPLVFYRPSIWRCLDCGYEGAFIIEDGELARILQEQYRRGCGITDWTLKEYHIDSWNGSNESWPKTLEGYV